MQQKAQQKLGSFIILFFVVSDIKTAVCIPSLHSLKAVDSDAHAGNSEVLI